MSNGVTVRLRWGATALAVVVATAVGAWWITAHNTDSAPRWLFSHTAGSGSLEQNADGTFTLTLNAIDPHVVAFADRPVRDVDILDVTGLIGSWPEFFAGSSPNAVLVEHNPRGQSDSVVLTIGEPSLTIDPTDGSKSLIFQANVIRDEFPERLVELSGVVHRTLPGRFEEVSLFIDDVTSDYLGGGAGAGEVPAESEAERVAEPVETLIKEEQEADLMTEEKEDSQIKEVEQQKLAEQKQGEEERKDLTQDMFP